MDDVFHVVTISTFEKFRQPTQKTISNASQQDDYDGHLDPVEILFFLFNSAFSGRRSGWFRINRHDLAEVWGLKRLSPEFLKDTIDKLKINHDMWLLDLGHFWVVIRDQTLRKVRKVPKETLVDFVSGEACKSSS